MTPIELKRFIRFRLSELRAANAHHEFEELCRYLAKARLCSDILPATGPASAGGDQGRDFESFRTFLDRHPDMFGGVGDGQTIVFACTLQQGRVEEKIKADVATIIGETDLPADAIVAFCEMNLPVGRRNRLRAEMRREHEVDLQVFDGNAISELLSTSDTAWIAQRFLDLPAEFIPTPRSDADDDWYLEQRAKWGARERPHATWGDFADVKNCLRFVYQSGRFTEDLDWWIEVLSTLVTDTTPGPLRRHAIYEVTLASLRGKGTLQPWIESLEWYFSTIAEVMPSGELEDAQALLGFCFGSTAQPDGGVATPEVERWRSSLIEHVDREIEGSDNPARLISLLLTRGALELFRRPSPTFDDIHRFWKPGLAYADAATTFPVERFADMCVPLAVAFADVPTFRTFVDEVDAKVAEQAGSAAVAERAQERGLALAQAARFLLCLQELHRAKDGWIESHDIGGALSTTGMLATVYRDLGLYWAAKHYYLAMVMIAINSSDRDHSEFVSRGLINAALCDYATGAWAGFCALADMGLRAHGYLDPDAGDERHDVLQQLAMAAGFVCPIAELHYPDFADEARTIAEAVLPDGFLDELRDDPPPWMSDRATVEQHFRDQAAILPFGDCAEVRTLSWQAYGVTWVIQAELDWQTSLAVERLASTMQILQAEIRQAELCPLPMVARARVAVGPEPYAVESSDLGFTFDVVLPSWTGGSHEDFEVLSLSTLTPAITLIAMTTTASRSEFMGYVEEAMEHGLPNKLSLVAAYDELLSQWLDADRFDSAHRLGMSVPVDEAATCSEAGDELGWPDGPGPGYSAERARAFLENRYRNLERMTVLTRERLAGSTAFGQIVESLRADGWLDWHILGAINSIALTYRARLAGAFDNREVESTMPVSTGLESPDAAVVPTAEFSEEAMRMVHGLNNASSLVTTWDRVLHLKQVDPGPVEQLLAYRYRHYEDDIEHEDLFSSSGGPSSASDQ